MSHVGAKIAINSFGGHVRSIGRVDIGQDIRSLAFERSA